MEQVILTDSSSYPKTFQSLLVGGQSLNFFKFKGSQTLFGFNYSTDQGDSISPLKEISYRT